MYRQGSSNPAFLVLLGLAGHLLLPQIAMLEHSLQVIKGMSPSAVGLTAGVQVLTYLGGGVLLQAIVAMTGDRLSVVQITRSARRRGNR